jgi:predicted metalloprotease with PDZ domain
VAKDAMILPRDFHRPFFTPLGNLGEYKVKSIGLGRAMQPNLQADVWNHPTVEELSAMFGRFEGLIGFPFFSRYAVTIDYKSKTMALVPCAYLPTDTKEKMTQKMMGGESEKLFAPTESLGIVVTKDAKDESAGVTISKVLPHGPADNAGLLPGDRLLTLDGRWTDSVEDCYAALSGVDSSRPIDVTLKRDRSPLKTKITVKPAI